MKHQGFLIPLTALLLFLVASGCDELDPACEGADYQETYFKLPDMATEYPLDGLRMFMEGGHWHAFKEIVVSNACGSSSFDVHYVFGFDHQGLINVANRIMTWVQIDAGEYYYPPESVLVDPEHRLYKGGFYTLNKENQKATPASFTFRVGFHFSGPTLTETEAREIMKPLLHYFMFRIEYLKLQ